MTIILQLLEICFFCHIKTTTPLNPDINIVEVPPAIGGRLSYNYSQCFGEFVGSKEGSIRAGCNIVYDNGRYYFHINGSFTDVGKVHVWTIYQLKDI